MRHDPRVTRDQEDASENPAVGEWPGIYVTVASRALTLKAILQMVVGVVMTVGVIFALVTHLGSPLHKLQHLTFDVIGVGLAVAAAVELGYTLFTHGPDEA